MIKSKEFLPNKLPGTRDKINSSSGTIIDTPCRPAYLHTLSRISDNDKSGESLGKGMLKTGTIAPRTAPLPYPPIEKEKRKGEKGKEKDSTGV